MAAVPSNAFVASDVVVVVALAASSLTGTATSAAASAVVVSALGVSAACHVTVATVPFASCSSVVSFTPACVTRDNGSLVADSINSEGVGIEVC